MKHRYEPFWFDQALGLEQQVTVSALRADTTADICIVGGGALPVCGPPLS